MSRQFRLLFVVLAAIGLVGVACSSDDDLSASGAPQLADVDATGRELATEFLTILQDGDVDELGEFLADGFQIQRANGSGATRSEYLENPAQIDSFELGEMLDAIQDDDVLTVRWTLQVSEVIDGEEFGQGEAPRLSTFVYVDGRWRLLSHANFNLPSDEAGAPQVDDVEATGRELVTEFLTIVQDGDVDELEEFLADGFALQRANGSGSTKAEYLENFSQIESFELGDFLLAEQQGDVITVRWTLQIDEVIDGEQFGLGEAPRLSTFVWVDGRWRIISHANFLLPEDS